MSSLFCCFQNQNTGTTDSTGLRTVTTLPFAMPKTKKLMIIDCDPGVDDTYAMFMGFAYHDRQEVEVLAITTTHGNASLEYVIRNTFIILNKAGKQNEIPVYKGAANSLAGRPSKDDEYHGVDGLGEVEEFQEPEVEMKVQEEHAVTALLRLANEHPGQISLVCLGPLTNIALAIRMDPEFGSKLKECYIMGGNYEGKGNVTVGAEFNFYKDPEAAFVTLRELKCPITLICWELCTDQAISRKWYRRNITSIFAKGKFVRRIEKFTLENVGLDDCQKYIVPDAVTMAVAINPKVIKKKEMVNCTVELTGTYTRGQMVVDWKERHLTQRGNITLVRQVELEALKKMILVAVTK